MVFLNGDFFKYIQSNYLSKYGDVQNIHFRNYEAVFPENQKHFFDTNRFLDCGIYKNCKSYANGKSAGVINSNNLRLRGPHNFSGKTINVSDNLAKVLHFDSGCFDKWYKKFSNLAQLTSQEKFEKIPFDFSDFEACDK